MAAFAASLFPVFHLQLNSFIHANFMHLMYTHFVKGAYKEAIMRYLLTSLSILFTFPLMVVATESPVEEDEIDLVKQCVINELINADDNTLVRFLGWCRRGCPFVVLVLFHSNRTQSAVWRH